MLLATARPHAALLFIALGFRITLRPSLLLAFIFSSSSLCDGPDVVREIV